MFERKLGVSGLLDLDNQRHSSFRTPHREWLPGVLVRDRVQVLEIRIGATLDHAAAKLSFLVGIVEVDDGESGPRIAPGIPPFNRAFSGTDQNAITLSAHPNRVALRCSVRQQGGEVREVGAIDQSFYFPGKWSRHAD